jgi:hypothetical protein
LNIAPASAIFGLSKCEKANKAIIEEEKIGLRLWKDFDQIRDSLLKKKTYAHREFYNAVEKEKLVKESDLRVYKIADRNASCFKPGRIMFARSETNNIMEWLRVWSKNKSKWNLATTELKTSAGNDYLTRAYQSYHAFVSGKKMG